MRQVVIIQKFIHQYRKTFYDRLRDELLKNDIALKLIYGKLNTAEAQKKDQIDMGWGTHIDNRTLRLGKSTLLWQPCLKELKRRDIVIVEQANKLLLNYYLMLSRNSLGIRLCYWGHGRNLQQTADSLPNKLKYLFINKCDWWFAYTNGVKNFLIDKGFSENKITIVQNAIDTQSLLERYAATGQTEVDELKARLGIAGDRIGIYCGAMYREKRIDFLLESCFRIKQKIPDFHMIFVGAGPDAAKVAETSKKNDWMHYVGPKFGQDRVPYFKLAALQLMPGAVGLGILDSFALETPLITTSQSLHGPEIDYLVSGENGLITNDRLIDYTDAVIHLLSSGKYTNMAEMCRLHAEKYTIENMVQNFTKGVLECLQTYN